jgi:tetratricopeptide (TPR) repeat protein
LAREPHAETYHQLGLALRNLGRFDEALAQFDQALTFAPGTGFYYFSRGRLRARLGDEAGASADFQAYLRLVPSDPERREKVQTWLAQRGFSN